MKVKVEVVENATGKALANPVFMDDVTFEEVIPMVDETWSVHSAPATGWDVVSNCCARKRVWNFGEKFGLNCFVTTYIAEVK